MTNFFSADEGVPLRGFGSPEPVSTVLLLASDRGSPLLTAAGIGPLGRRFLGSEGAAGGVAAFFISIICISELESVGRTERSGSNRFFQSVMCLSKSSHSRLQTR